MQEQYTFTLPRQALQSTLAQPVLPGAADLTAHPGTLGTQFAYFLLSWLGHPAEALVVVEEVVRDDDLLAIVSSATRTMTPELLRRRQHADQRNGIDSPRER